MFRPPHDPPPSAADDIARLNAEIEELRYRAASILDAVVLGPRGHLLTIAEAQHRAEELGAAIDDEEAAHSQRHRRVALATRIVTLLVVAVVDFPIMLWLAGSVFNVDWGAVL